MAAGLSATVILLGWRGSDLPAQEFRIGIVRRFGVHVWDNFWFGGHYTVGYGLLGPLLGALFGMWTVALISAAVAAWLADQLIVGGIGRRSWPASLWFAAGTASNMAVGRLAFGLGMMTALGAVLAFQRGRRVPALLLSAATAMATPVASVFLAVVWCAVAITSPARRGTATALLAASVVPVLGVAVIYPQGGTFPFHLGALVVIGVSAAVVAGAAWRSARPVAVTAIVYAAAASATFAVPTPLGANIGRIGMYAAAPALLAVAPSSRKLLVAALPVFAFWQWSPAVDAAFRAGHDPSIHAEYYEPLNKLFASRTVRVEVVPTYRHWETAYVALHVPIARGWERQLDRRYNSLFYESGLTTDAYVRWLHDTGVSYVALADAPLDSAGRDEAALIESGVPGLRQIWSSGHWRVWAVDGSPGLVSGPARLVHVGVNRLAVDVTGPGDVTIRVRELARWTAEPPACVTTTEDGWIRLHAVTPGRYDVFVPDAPRPGKGCAS